MEIRIGIEVLTSLEQNEMDLVHAMVTGWEYQAAQNRDVVGRSYVTGSNGTAACTARLSRLIHDGPDAARTEGSAPAPLAITAPQGVTTRQILIAVG